MPSSLVVWHGPRSRRRVALTFDDGPGPLTRAYLDELDRARARATFFVVGQMCASRRGDLLEIVRRGHEVAGHGYLHERFPTLSRTRLLEELEKTSALLPLPVLGRALVRPPHGAISLGCLAKCAAAGYRSVLWSLDSNDCRTRDCAEVETGVIERARPGDIILLHEEQQWTLDAISGIVRGLRGASFELVTVSELLSPS